MSVYLQFALILISVLTFLFVLYCSIVHRMNIRYAVLWTLWSISVIILSVFPDIIDLFTSILNIASPVNTLFLIMMFLLYLISFYIFLKISLLNEQVKNISYELALLKKRFDDKENMCAKENRNIT